MLRLVNHATFIEGGVNAKSIIGVLKSWCSANGVNEELLPNLVKRIEYGYEREIEATDVLGIPIVRNGDRVPGAVAVIVE